MRSLDSMSLRFFPLSQSRSKIQLSNSGQPRIKSQENVQNLHNSGHFDCHVDSKLWMAGGWYRRLLPAERFLLQQCSTEKQTETLYDLSQKILKTVENKLVTHLRPKQQFPFISGNEFIPWTTSCGCYVRKSSGQPGNLRQSIIAIPLIFIPLPHMWGF